MVAAIDIEGDAEAAGVEFVIDGRIGIGILAIAQVCFQFKVTSHHRASKTAFEAVIDLKPYRRNELRALWATLDGRWPRLPADEAERLACRWVAGKTPYSRIRRHAVRLQPNARPRIGSFAQRFAALPGVLNVFFLAGVNDFQIHLAARSADDLRDFVVKNLSASRDVATTETNLIFEHITGTALT